MDIGVEGLELGDGWWGKLQWKRQQTNNEEGQRLDVEVIDQSWQCADVYVLRSQQVMKYGKVKWDVEYHDLLRENVELDIHPLHQNKLW